MNYDKLLLKLESEKNRYQQLLIENEKKEHLLSRRMEEYKVLKAVLDTKKKEIINEAKIQASALLEETNKRIEKTIREIKETQADKERTKKLRESLDSHKTAIRPEKIKVDKKIQEVKVIDGEILPGDHVRLKDNGAIAEVLSIQQKTAEISMGDLKSKVKIDRLEKISAATLKKEKRSIPRNTGYDPTDKMMDFSTNLDLRGKRGEEILLLLQNFIDEGYMLGMKDLRVIHGKGDGILRDLTRNMLRQMNMVSRFTDEHVEKGGAGVTLVALKEN